MHSIKSSPVTARQKQVLAQRAIAEETEDEILDAELSDDGDQGIDSVKYLLVLQQIRQEAFRASRASLQRQLTLLAAEFRGQAAASFEEMNAYMRVLLQYDGYMRCELISLPGTK